RPCGTCPADGSSWDPLRLLEVQLQSELDDPHRRTQSADLTHARPVGNNRVVGREPDAVRRTKIGVIERVEKFAPELDARALDDIEVLEERGIEGALPWRVEDRNPAVAGVAQVGPGCS